MISKCAFCLSPLHEANAPRCPICETRHHAECWLENGGCAQFGCANAPLPPPTF